MIDEKLSVSLILELVEFEIRIYFNFLLYYSNLSKGLNIFKY